MRPLLKIHYHSIKQIRLVQSLISDIFTTTLPVAEVAGSGGRWWPPDVVKRQKWTSSCCPPSDGRRGTGTATPSASSGRWSWLCTAGCTRRRLSSGAPTGKASRWVPAWKKACVRSENKKTSRCSFSLIQVFQVARGNLTCEFRDPQQVDLFQTIELGD